jgi:GNAT superfamily N-acetyltransferase
MRSVLSDFSKGTLVRAIHANWADSYTYFGRSCSAELSVGAHLTWLLTGIPDSFLNVVFRTQLPSVCPGDLIDETLAYFKARNVQKLSWWAECETPRTELEKQLVSRGLIFEEGGTGMVADLKELHEDLRPLPGLMIVPVENIQALRQWVHIMRIGFGIPEYAEGRLFDLFADVAFEPPMQSYLAVLNGQPVGTSQFFLSAGVAGVYNVTCLPEARGQGIGAAVTLAAMREARLRGYRISILQASHLGYPVYRRLGFQDYGKLNVYLYENQTEPSAAQDQDR